MEGQNDTNFIQDTGVTKVQNFKNMTSTTLTHIPSTMLNNDNY